MRDFFFVVVCFVCCSFRMFKLFVCGLVLLQRAIDFEIAQNATPTTLFRGLEEECVVGTNVVVGKLCNANVKQQFIGFKVIIAIRDDSRSRLLGDCNL